ncbi:transmembrane protein 93, putative [Acanthamoeba castellanii str. Neff]|uniref:ER membrane protein complex subunit 6 n=1 Tax=Acanthamoeba castellanii (strain ATCC 30010 / Neff) TaxID=1257118 RepID=L8GY61_ACACF|nr:transmembrane protein 93, putative [Acanthamoeba castellanii str. Neff]ELR17488.1 transmembrane protein 93, putative [Acanthamoeba castellanii str. Neff]
MSKDMAKQGEPGELHNPEAIAHNNRAIFFCRIIVASVAGSAAGILGVTGLGGFIFYAAASALVSLLVLHRTGYNTSKYFTSPSALWTEAVGQGLLSYVLFWTLFYGFAYIF